MLWLPTSLPNQRTAENRQQWGYGLPDQPSAAEAEPARAAASPRTRLEHMRGDIVGGIAAAVLTIPVSMGYGLLALAPLGEAFVPHAIMAGVFAPVFGCIVALLLRANTTMVYSPRSIVTFLIGAFVLHSLVHSDAAAIAGAPAAVLLTLALIALFLTGLFQSAFGLLRLGSLIKYVPAPVIAGFQNAAAILIFMSQMGVLLGTGGLRFEELGTQLLNVKWSGLFVGVLTCMLMLRGARITKRIPPTIVGLLGGVIVYYALALLGLSQGLGPTVGAARSALPEWHAGDFLRVLGSMNALELAPTIVGGALSLAIVASLDALLCARLVQADSGQRIDDNRELIRLGAGNMVGACFGTIANGINLGSSFANYRSGARTPLSVLVHAVTILGAAVALWPLVSYLPRVVIAGLLLAIAVQLVDRWTLDILKNVLTRSASGPRLLTDLLVIAIVTVSAVVLNIMSAVLIGTAVAVVFFLLRMSKSVIRRAYRCDAVHSRKTRAPRHMEILGSHGARILVLELEGPVFFGTAEDLAHRVETEMRQPTSCVIFDLKRVNDVDSTGAKILLQMHDRLTKQGRHLVLCGLDEHAHIAGFMRDMGVTAALTRSRLFADTDQAIEWAEDHVILLEEAAVSGEEFPFERLDVFGSLDPDELRVVREMLERREYAAGEVVFSEGDDSKELYVIGRGSASVRLRLPGSGRETRLITFSPGTVFGELALLDQEARSASVRADGELVCYVLSHEHFIRITRDNPRIAITILTNLGRELSSRLRRANRTIYQLAS